MDIFRPVVEGSKLPQYTYPRRPDDEELWNLVYLFMYGILGIAAQWGGLQISSRKISKDRVVWYARLYGSFHLVLAMHHLIWSQKRNYGKL